MKKLLLIALTLFSTSLQGLASTPHPYTIFQDKDTGYYGIMQNQKVIIPAKYQKIYASPNALFSPQIQEDTTSVNTEVLLSVVQDNELFRINKQGKILFKVVWHDNGPDYYVDGLSRFISEDNKIGFHDKKGNIKIPAKYDFAAPFDSSSYDYTTVCNGCYLIPLPGTKETPLTANAAGITSILEYNIHYYYRPLQGGKWGVIDKSGNEIVPLEHPNYDAALAELKKTSRNQDPKLNDKRISLLIIEFFL